MSFPPVTFGLMRIFNAVILLMVSNLVSYLVFVVNHVLSPTSGAAVWPAPWSWMAQGS